MPYAKKTKKRTNKRKRTYKKRRGVFRLQKSMPVGFPKTNVVKLRYVESFEINPTTGALGYHRFRANSCFDPNYTGTGHQPNGFEQWSQFYNHYVVIGSKINVRFTLASLTTDTGGMMVCGVSLTDDVTSTSSLTLLLEQSQTRKTTGVFNFNNNPRSASKGYSAKKFFNVTNISDNWSRLGALVTASPNEEAYFSVYVGNANAAIDPPTLTCLATIEYICMFSEPKELPES